MTTLVTTLLLPALLAPAVLGDARISVNTTSIMSGDSVQVSWSGVPAAPSPMHVMFATDYEHVQRWKVEPEGASSLWVGQFSPPITSAADIYMDVDPRSRGIATEGTPPFTVPAPVKFISGTQLASGAYTFKVSNMRAPVNWVLFNGSLTNATDFEVLAVSPSVVLRDAASPMHVRLTRTSSVEEIRVSWTSAQGAGEANHVVEWGAAAGSLDRTTPASSTHTYTPADLCGFPANESGFRSPGYFHEAVLPLGESYPTRWYYRVGSATFGWSKVRSFASPAPASPHAALSLVVTADMGETYEDGSQYHWEEPSGE
jgi:hypothetical protein